MPVGGVLLGESIIEPHSGKMVRVGGATVRAGQLYPNAGGHQALLESKVQNMDNFYNFSLKSVKLCKGTLMPIEVLSTDFFSLRYHENYNSTDIAIHI